MVIDGQEFCTLEPPWLDNRRNVSCIPAGEYRCEFLAKSASGKYKDVFHLQDVPGRSGILIHNGNLVSHTKGCILLGMRHGRLAGQRAVLNSRAAMSQLGEYKQSFELVIV